MAEWQPASKEWRAWFKQNIFTKEWFISLAQKWEQDKKGVLLISDRGQLCKEKLQQGHDGEGLIPILITGWLEMKSQPISVGGHSNSRLCHSKI